MKRDCLTNSLALFHLALLVEQYPKKIWHDESSGQKEKQLITYRQRLPEDFPEDILQQLEELLRLPSSTPGLWAGSVQKRADSHKRFTYLRENLPDQIMQYTFNKYCACQKETWGQK